MSSSWQTAYRKKQLGMGQTRLMGNLDGLDELPEGFHPREGDDERVDETTRMRPTFCIECLIGHSRANTPKSNSHRALSEIRERREDASRHAQQRPISVTEMSHFPPTSECIPDGAESLRLGFNLVGGIMH